MDTSKKKFNIISLFSGSGGLDLGFLKTNRFEILLANDFNKYACESYKNNIGDHIICGDISSLTNIPLVDVVIGGPPCQGFSTANPNRSFDDPRNWLFKEYARIIKESMPRIFVLENVSGMVTLEKGKVLEIIIEELSNLGYDLSYKILNSKNFRSPQSRRRTIIVGVKSELRKTYKFPEPEINPPLFGHYRTVGDAFYEKEIPKDDPNHVIASMSELNALRIKHIPEGGSMKDCPEGLRNNSDLKRAMRRLSRYLPSPTIVHNNGDHYYHPLEDRRITIREMARLQGYPDNYIFYGPKSEQSRQVGNSVPIPLGEAIAKSVVRFLDDLEVFGVV